MQRVVVIGSGGSGKTTVAKVLSERTRLPVVHLDPLFWRAGWIPAPRDEALRDLKTAAARDRWILDGNFLPEDGVDPRFERADTVIFLDLPRALCVWRIFGRLVRDRARSRADLPKGSKETFDPSYLRWVWSYPRATRPQVLRLLARLDKRVRLHHLRSPRDVKRFLSGLSA